MKQVPFLFLFLFAAHLAQAEIKRSSRNLEPLSKRSETNAQSTDAPAPAQGESVPGSETKFSFLGPKTGWGLIKETASYYSPQGKNLGTLSAGTLFTYSDVKSSSRNSVLVSMVKHGDTWEGPYLLDCIDIVSYGGAPDQMDPGTLKDLTDYFVLKGKIQERKTALADQVAATNPYYKTAKQTAQAYQDSIDKAAEMQKQLGTLTGLRKAKADDALRSLKYEQARIKQKADQAAAAFKAWSEAHPSAAIATDVQLKTLEQAFKTVSAKVSKLVPPET